MPLRDLLGHRVTTRLLSRALAAGTLPPSLILAGPDGVGKRQTAIAVAQAMNCLAPRRGTGEELPLDACGACTACNRIARGIHPDVQVIEPGETGSIKIDTVREAVRATGFRPFEGRRRVIIFDSAEALGADAQDALLKTLEEPPPSSVLILVTSLPDQLLPTVRSRCPVVRFAPLSPSEIAAWLTGVGGLDDTRAHAVAAVARGSLTVAREIADTGAEGVRGAAQRVLEQVAGARDARAKLAATRDLVGKGRAGAGERQALAAHLHALASLVRDLGSLSTRSDHPLANADLAPALAGLARSFDTDRACHAFAAIDRALEALERNASPKLVADWIVLKL